MSLELSWKDVFFVSTIVGGFIFGGAILIGLGISSIDTSNQNLRFASIIGSIAWMVVSPFTFKKLDSKIHSRQSEK